MKDSWKNSTIILGSAAIVLMLVGAFGNQPGIATLGNFCLGLTLFSCGAAHIEEKARRKAQSEEVIDSQV